MDFKLPYLILFQIFLAINLSSGQIRPTPPPVQVPPFTNCTQYSTSKDFWFTYTGSQYCYHYTSYSGDYYSYSQPWQYALSHCRQKKASLVSIHDFRTNYILSHPLAMPSGSYQGWYWLGLTSLNNTRGVYKWSDGSPHEYLGNISTTQPSGAKLDPNVLNQGRCIGTYVVPQNSAYFKYYKDKIGLWYKADCNQAMYSICRKSVNPNVPPPTLPPTTPGGCPTGWYKYADQKCVKYIATKGNFNQSQKLCQANKGEMLSIHSVKEQDFMTAITFGLPAPYIGLTRSYSYAAFKWEDQSTMDFTNIGVGQAYYGANKNCMLMVTNLTQPGKWVTANCAEPHPVVCQLPQDPKVSTGLTLSSNKCAIKGFSNYIQHRKSCYSVVETAATSFAAAEQVCKNAGAHLVSILDGEEESFLRYYLQQNGKSKKYYIGLQSLVDPNSGSNPQNQTQVFEWSDTWPMYYSNWARFEPKYPKTPQNQCVFMERVSGLWTTISCDGSLPFVCKTSSVKPPNFDSIDKNGVCPQLAGNTDSSLAWVNLHKGTPYCYWFSTERKGIKGSVGLMSYSDASFTCRRRNGTLVSIHSNHVMKLLMYRLSSKIQYFVSWIGLSRNPDGEFGWEDNSAIDYTNGLPLDEMGNTTNLNDDSSILCAELKYDGTWVWGSCLSNERHYYVCQTQKLFSSSSDTSHAGRTAGIVIGVLLAIAALVGVVYYVRKNNMKMPEMPSFENPLSRNKGNTGKSEKFENPSEFPTTHDSPFRDE